VAEFARAQLAAAQHDFATRSPLQLASCIHFDAA
jgi:hypothetical protein